MASDPFSRASPKRKWSPSEDTVEEGTIRGDSPATRHTTALDSTSRYATLPKRIKLERRDSSTGVSSLSRILTIPSDRSEITPEIWQHIFTFVPPISLGRLMLVNKRFNLLLSAHEKLPPPHKPGQGLLSLQRQNEIWATARKRFSPAIPRPPAELLEADIWRLITGRNCQYCQKKPNGKLPIYTSAPWSSGPGLDNVRVIWPFGVRSCGSCLRARIKKVRWTQALTPLQLSDCVRIPSCCSSHSHRHFYRHYPLPSSPQVLIILHLRH